MDEHPRLLTRGQQALLADERALLVELRTALARYGAADDDQAALDRSIRQLDGLFLVVVVGEFNAGKSAVINELVGADVLEEGVTPTTARITVVRFGATQASTVTGEGIVEITAPIDLLRELHVVDTPGTNAVLREHEAVTRRFVPAADMVLFVTSADRPFTESERAFLERIRDWGKKIVVLVNKVDILESADQVAEVMGFLRDGARRMLGIEPAILAVSARAARQSRRGEPRLRAASGVDAVLRYLQDVLDETERVRLKLLNPIGVGSRATAALLADLTSRLDLLGDDVKALEEVDRQLRVYADDMQRDFGYRWADIEKLLVEMERRGHDHFDETIRLGRVTDLVNRTRTRQLFEQRVVADTPQRLERKVSELIDWIVDADFRQWQAVSELLAERRMAYRDRFPGVAAPGGFHHDRSRLVDSVGREAQRVVETYDRAREAGDLAEKARAAVATSAAIEVGAAGLGAVVAAVATTAAADMTGFAMAGVLATLGLLVIPNRRRRAKQELRTKVTEMRERLGRSLRGAFEDELRRSLEKVRTSIEPYSRFVRAEREHLVEARAALEGLSRGLDALRARVEST